MSPGTNTKNINFLTVELEVKLRLNLLLVYGYRDRIKRCGTLVIGGTKGEGVKAHRVSASAEYKLIPKLNSSDEPRTEGMNGKICSR